MELTISFIRNSFRKYNDRYFNGELIEPNFNIINTKSVLGRFRYRTCHFGWGNPYTIEISKYYDRTEKHVDNTIIHEMIHQYIKQKNIKDSSSHGYHFKRIAERINRDGWEIYRCSSIGGLGVSACNIKDYHIFMMKNKDGKYFLFSSAKAAVERYKVWLTLYKYEFKYLVSRDSVKYGSLSTCRTRIRGVYISKDEYDNC